MARKAAKPGITGIEPHQMSLPAMDRPSVAFAWFLDSMIIAWDDEGERLLLVCNLCQDGLCTVDDSDTLRVLLNTALAHTCGATS